MENRQIFAINLLLIVPVVLAVLLIAPVTADALTYEYKQYTVKKGDTLWSITKRELVDAYQWPLVWMENRRINDPDLIYPGQVILIPIRAIAPGIMEPRAGEPEEMEEVPEEPGIETGMEPTVEQEKAAKKKERTPLRRNIVRKEVEPIVSRELLIEAGYITRYLPDAGSVQGDPLGRIIFGLHDVIYIETKVHTEKGQKFYITRKMTEVEHPVTKEDYGWAMKVIAVVEALESGDDELKAKVIENFDSIQPGDLLDPYIDVFIPFAPSDPRMPEFTGHVLRSGYTRFLSGGYDVIFIDKGSEDGIEVGDIFITLMQNTNDTVNGVIQIINVRHHTALAVVQKSRQQVVKGDVFRGFMVEPDVMEKEDKPRRPGKMTIAPSSL